MSESRRFREGDPGLEAGLRPAVPRRGASEPELEFDPCAFLDWAGSAQTRILLSLQLGDSAGVSGDLSNSSTEIGMPVLNTNRLAEARVCVSRGPPWMRSLGFSTFSAWEWVSAMLRIKP